MVKPRWYLGSLAALVLVSSFGSTGVAASGGLRLAGDAVRLPDRIRLTTADPGQVGAAWSRARVRVAARFVASFSFQMSGGGGADGLAFVIQNTDRSAIGDSGGNLGYGGVPNSLAIEFDTWENVPGDFGTPGVGDPDDNHISVQTNGTDPNSADHLSSLMAVSEGLPDLNDGEAHHVRVRYRAGTLNVWLDDLETPRLSVDVEIGSLLDLGRKGRAWVGVTAATGAVAQLHDVWRWRIGGRTS